MFKISKVFGRTVKGLKNQSLWQKFHFFFCKKNSMALLYFIQGIKLFMIGQLFVMHTY